MEERWTCSWCGVELTSEELSWDRCANCGQPVLIDEGDPWWLDDAEYDDSERSE